ncbi:hypothetical protein TNCV_4725721 [Trichonephila clavipes]|nr:hypothetical protein TNCV_4725721 [Trichonephila clavipes]
MNIFKVQEVKGSSDGLGTLKKWSPPPVHLHDCWGISLGQLFGDQDLDYCRQEVEPMDWKDTPFLPEVSAPLIPTRPPRKMRSLISVQVSEPPSLSTNRFPNMRALVPKEGGVSLHSRGCPEGLLKRAASRDQSSRPPSGVPRATLFFERCLRTITTMSTFKLTRQVGNPDFACAVNAELAAKCFISYKYRQYGYDNTITRTLRGWTSAHFSRPYETHELTLGLFYSGHHTEDYNDMFLIPDTDDELILENRDNMYSPYELACETIDYKLYAAYFEILQVDRQM